MGWVYVLNVYLVQGICVLRAGNEGVAQAKHVTCEIITTTAGSSDCKPAVHIHLPASYRKYSLSRHGCG